MFFYILSNYYNQRLFFGFSKNHDTLERDLRTNKQFKQDSKNKFCKVVYIVFLKNEAEAIEKIEHFKTMKKARLYDYISNVNPQWNNILV